MTSDLHPERRGSPSTVRLAVKTKPRSVEADPWGRQESRPVWSVQSVSVRLVVTCLAPNRHQDPRHRPQECKSPAMATGLLLMIYLQNRLEGGEGGIRTPGTSCEAQRFSRPPHSTALPPLRGRRDSSGNWAPYPRATTARRGWLKALLPGRAALGRMAHKGAIPVLAKGPLQFFVGIH